jgi:hypothetical protein
MYRRHSIFVGTNFLIARSWLTLDRGFEYEHNLSKLQFGIIIVHVPKNKIAFYRPLREKILAAVDRIPAGRVVHIR